MTRQEYIDQCKVKIKQFRENATVVHTYIRDRKNNKVGVLLAYQPNGSWDVFVGFSKCNTKLEPFDRWIGILKAINKAKPLTQGPYKDWRWVPYYPLPSSIQKEFYQFVERIKRYFKLDPQPIPKESEHANQ